MPNAAKARRWTKLQTVAWIAFRTNAAVCKAATLTSFAALAAAASLGDFRVAGGGQDAALKVSEAMDRVDEARQDGRFRADSDGRYPSANVRRLFPSAEGRGKGQLRRTRLRKWKPRGHDVAPSVGRLAWHFLTTPRNMTWDKLRNWCWEEDSATSKKQYEQLRREALSQAQNTLQVLQRWNPSVADALDREPGKAQAASLPKPRTEAELREYEQNLRSWS
jgi:hypothetical protein